MCSAFNHDFRYDNSNIKLIMNVYCLITMCSDIHCLHKKTYQSLGGSDYECPQFSFTSQVRETTFEEQTSSFFMEYSQGIFVFESTKKSIQDF